MNRWTFAAAVAAFMVLSCADPAGLGDTSAPTPAKPASLSFDAASLSDTIQVTLAAPVTATVLDSAGHGLPNVAVSFVAPTAALSINGVTFAQGIESGKTDSTGKIRLYVRLDTVSGTSYLRASITSTTLKDSIPVVILPGNLVSLSLAPRDSVVYVNGTYVIRADCLDAKNNHRNDVVTYTARTSGVITMTDSTIRGQAFGRTRLVAELGLFRDSVFVSVIPTATIAAFASPAPAGSSSDAFHVVNLDGSGHSQVMAHSGNSVRFNPSGTKIVFHGFTANQGSLFTINLDGTGLQQIAPASPNTQETQPQYSRDGNWIYYTGYAGDLSVWRATSDFATRARLTPAGKKEFTPTPSPDGSKLAYFEGLIGDQPIQIRTLASGTVDTTTILGAALRWSPVGDEIAYIVGNQLRAYNTVTRNVTTLDSAYAHHFSEPNIDWSPDGQWLLSCAYYNNPNPTGYLVLVRKSPPLAIPLMWTKTWNLCAAAWKP